jgi:2',3'-cyclic-nucleotide 2'-phosphodiesterase (5'-nucleotidase family)
MQQDRAFVVITQKLRVKCGTTGNEEFNYIIT